MKGDHRYHEREHQGRDAVKCNLRQIVDYPNLWNYTKELYQVPGVAETCNLDHIK
jgi:glutathionyl-hydroquinone reductase